MDLDFDIENMTDEDIEDKIEEAEKYLDYLKKHEEACGFSRSNWYEEQNVIEFINELKGYL